MLAPLHERGYSVGTVHPLQSMSGRIDAADRLPGSYFSISGEPGALATARRLLGYLGAPTVTVPVVRRPLYHAAAVLASSGVIAILAAAARLMNQAGVPGEDAVKALLPLVRGTLENLESQRPERALTGPVARGDADTVRLHLKMLERRERVLYAALGAELAVLAGEMGLEEDKLGELNDLFESEQ